MKFLARVLIFFLSISLVGVVLTWHTLHSVGNEESLDNALKKSGVYSQLSGEVQKKINTELDKDPTSPVNMALKSAVSKVVTEENLEKLITPFLSGFTKWLNSPSDVSAPQLKIDLTNIKQNLVEATEASGLTPAQLKFEITKSIPDTITFPPDNSGAVEDVQGYNNSLNSLKNNYKKLRNSLTIQLIICFALIGVIVLASLRNKRAMLRRPAIAFLFSAVVLAILSYPLLFALKSTILSAKTFDSSNAAALYIARGLSKYALTGLAPYALGLLLIGLVGFGISFGLPKPEKKK